MWWHCGIVLNSTTLPLIFVFNACLIICEGVSSIILLFGSYLHVLSWAVSCFLVGFLFTFFVVYQNTSVFQNQWIPWNIFSKFALLAYDKMPCSCHLDWHISIWLWHRFSIKHPSIGLTMIKSLKRGLNKELFGYRWVDNLGCWVWEGWCVLIQAM